MTDDLRADRLLAGVDDALTVVQTAAFEVLSGPGFAEGLSRDAEACASGHTAVSTRVPGPENTLHSVKADRHPDVIRAQLQVLEDDINEAWRAVELSRERMDVRSSPSMYAVANGCDYRAKECQWIGRREQERAALYRQLGDLHDGRKEQQ